ncbi:MAG: permease-like cell division protein FtsX [Burkholderiales bacterium]|nr:ABC transporter permease [Burkholderiales bacterium]MCJ7838722.1 permease-like cell division protein FtsX [Burkholderiales bacterium]
MSTWLRQHWQTFRLTLGRLARNPLATLLNVTVIGVALALPLGGYMLLQNLGGVAHQVTGNPQVSLFLARDANKDDISALEARLKQIPGVRAPRFISRDEALEGLRQSENLSDVIAALRTNPLPDAFVLETNGGAAEVEKLEAQLRALPKVAHVQLDSTWVKRLESLLALGRMTVLILATLLACGLVAVTFNTIRLQIVTQKDEIEVSKLIGATDSFIRRPFFHLGLIQGGLGGMAALAIVYLSMHVLNRSILQVAQLYGSDFRLNFFGLPDCLALLAFAAVLGWLGAYMSVSRHLSGIEPR